MELSTYQQSPNLPPAPHGVVMAHDLEGGGRQQETLLPPVLTDCPAFLRWLLRRKSWFLVRMRAKPFLPPSLLFPPNNREREALEFARKLFFCCAALAPLQFETAMVATEVKGHGSRQQLVEWSDGRPAAQHYFSYWTIIPRGLVRIGDNHPWGWSSIRC